MNYNEARRIWAIFYSLSPSNKIPTSTIPVNTINVITAIAKSIVKLHNNAQLDDTTLLIANIRPDDATIEESSDIRSYL